MRPSLRTIKCSNQDGVSVVFRENKADPFLLADADGLYEQANKVTMSENTMVDGAQYQGSVASSRNIVLTLRDYKNNRYNRELLNTLFKKDEEGTLVYTEEEISRQINYYVESVKSTGTGLSRTYTISLQCPDPFFYAPAEVTVSMASWEDGFEFIHEFCDGEEFGTRSIAKSQNIVNENAADETGITVTIQAIGSAQNPSITRVESDETIKVGTSVNPLNLVAGDTVMIYTETGNKHVTLTRDGTTTEINNYLSEASEFIQLMRGDNNIGFTADAGASNLIVSISYRMKYASA